MKQYLELLQHVIENGQFRDDRTGTGTYSVFGAQQRFDLVFMDLTMPVMSGYDACRAITDADPSARVAIVSADIQPMARERCRDAGAFAFVSKPIARSQIHALVSGEAEKIAC